MKQSEALTCRIFSLPNRFPPELFRRVLGPHAAATPLTNYAFRVNPISNVFNKKMKSRVIVTVDENGMKPVGKQTSVI